MTRLLYGALLWMALPWLIIRLWWRARREPMYWKGVGQRFGLFRESCAPGSAPTIWVHAVSLGETRAAKPLLRALAAGYPDHQFVLTHMTATGRAAAMELAGERELGLAERMTLAWLPYDFPFAMRTFLRRFTPSVGILMETEVWPNLARECRRAGIPLALVNARLSEKSERGYRLAGALARQAFADLTVVVAQTEADARRLRDRGAREPAVAGNLKYDAAVRAYDEGERFRQLWGSRPVFLAASTREGEEASLLDAIRTGPPLGALIVIVPRHPQRFPEVADLIRSRGYACVLRSEELPVPDDAILLGDSIGEMPAYYAAADVVFVGGSLEPMGGQNLIEACAAGVPVLVGPHTFNFSDAADAAIIAGAALRAADAADCIRKVRALLADPDSRAAMGAAGLRFCESHRGATARTLAVIERLLRDPRS